MHYKGLEIFIQGYISKFSSINELYLADGSKAFTAV